MSFRRWAAATSAGVLILLGLPATAAAAEDVDECADAGLVSSLLGECGLLGALLGGSGSDDEPADEPPSTPAPGHDTGPDGSESGGASDGTGTGGPDPADTTDSAAASNPTAGRSGGNTSGGDASSQTGTTSHPTDGTVDSADQLESVALAPEVPAAGPPPGSAEAATGSAAQEPALINPGQAIGPLSEIPRAVGPLAPDIADATPHRGRVVSAALALIAAGLVMAITGVVFAVRRTSAETQA